MSITSPAPPAGAVDCGLRQRRHSPRTPARRAALEQHGSDFIFESRHARSTARPEGQPYCAQRLCRQSPSNNGTDRQRRQGAQALIAPCALGRHNSLYARVAGLAARGEHFSELLATRCRRHRTTCCCGVWHRKSEASHEACMRDERKPRCSPITAICILAHAACRRRRARPRIRHRYHQWPDNSWLMQAAGFGAAEHGRWPKRCACWTRRESICRPWQLYRTRPVSHPRLLGSDTKQLRRSSAQFDPAPHHACLGDRRRNISGTARAYHELAQGKLDAAC